MKFLILVAPLLLAGCATYPQPTVRAIRGSYGPPKDGYLCFSSVELRDHTYVLQEISDVVDESGKQLTSPETGHYYLNGCLLMFHPSKGHDFNLIITYRHGRYLLWAPTEYEEYLRTGHILPSVLYQQPATAAPAKMSNRRLLSRHTIEM